MNDYLGLSQLLKNGSMAPNDVVLNGTLRPEYAHGFVDAIKDNSAFLKKITIEKMKKLTKKMDAWDVARGILVRVPSGQAPTEAQRRKLDLLGCELNNKPVQLFARVLQDTLEDNADNPNFENETFNAFSKAFGNDLTLLGFTGIKDDYSGDKFEHLNKGWFTLASESPEVNKVEYTATTKISDRLRAVVDNINDDVFNDSVILINPKDYRAYQNELSEKAAASILIHGDAKEILGVSLEIHPLVKPGTYLATPIKNLVMGIGLNIRRNRWYENEERCLRYVFDLYCDYEIAVKKWTTLSTKKA